MNKQMILIIFYSLTNIMAKDSKIIKNNKSSCVEIINDNSKLSGIEIKVNKYGVKFNTTEDRFSKKKSTIIAFSHNKKIPNSTSLCLGTHIIFGDGKYPITISANNNSDHLITWPIEDAINILAINSSGQLITTTQNTIDNVTQLGVYGRNHIVCNAYDPITITTHAPANGDIVFSIDTQTNGNIKFLSNHINLIDGVTVLAVDIDNGIKTTESKLAYIGNSCGNSITVDNSMANTGINFNTSYTNQNIQFSLGYLGSMYIVGDSVQAPSLGSGSIFSLGINENYQVVSFDNSTPIPGVFSSLQVRDVASIGTYNTGISSSITINNTLSNNFINGVVINGLVYLSNTEFSLPGANQTTTLIIDMNGKIGVLLSSAKFKENIEPLIVSREAFNELRPSSFYYKNRKIGENTAQLSMTKKIGLIAEEVYSIEELKSLVILDANQEPLSVDYNALAVMAADQIIQDRKINAENINKLFMIISKLQEEIDYLKNK